MAQALTMAGGALQATGQIHQANAEAAAAEYNATNADNNAALADFKGADDARRIRLQAQKHIGEMRAAIGASGVQMDGSAVDALAESAANAEIDAQNAKYAGEQVGRNFRAQAGLDRMRGKNARIGGYLSAASTLINAGAKSGAMGAG